jgi:hypothetical protein
MRSQDRQTRCERGAGPSIRALLAVNAALLVLLAVVTFAPSADAQIRPPAKYAMVVGGVSGSTSSAVYIVDTVNQELMAVNYEHSTKRLKGIGYRNIAADMADMSRQTPGP